MIVSKSLERETLLVAWPKLSVLIISRHRFAEVNDSSGQWPHAQQLDYHDGASDVEGRSMYHVYVVEHQRRFAMSGTRLMLLVEHWITPQP